MKPVLVVTPRGRLTHWAYQYGVLGRYHTFCGAVPSWHPFRKVLSAKLPMCSVCVSKRSKQTNKV